MPLRVVGIGVDEDDTLPGAQGGAPGQDGNHQARRDEHGEHMVATVAGRAMPMFVHRRARQEPFEDEFEVVFGAAAGLEECNASSGVGDEDRAEPVASASAEIGHEIGHIRGQARPGQQRNDGRLHADILSHVVDDTPMSGRDEAARRGGICHHFPVSFSEFMFEVPVQVRFLLAIAITVGLSLLLASFFYTRTLHLTQETEQPEGEWPKIPEASGMVGRILALTSTAFVFLLAFTIAQMWGDSRDAETWNESMTVQFAQAGDAALGLPAGPERDGVINALNDFRTAVIDQQWPYLVRGDASGAREVHVDMVGNIVTAVAAAEQAGADKSPTWGSLTGSISDLASDNFERIGTIPYRGASQLMILVFFLGIANLVLTALFQPTRKRPYLFFVSVMATITAVLLFVMVEVSSPFAGTTGIVPMLMPVGTG